MTLASERTRSVQYAADFLLRLAVPAFTKRIPKSVREEARRILRHYPSAFDLSDLARRVPDRWGGPET